jgi:hypothetical protein
MCPAKRGNSYSIRRRSKSEQPPASRRGREHWTVRWIGAAKRRSKKPTKVAAIETLGGSIIRLSCADTFGRSVRPGVAGTVTQVLPFQIRSKGGDQQAAPPCAAD